ncbi:MAG: metallophosphoesterase [Chloroflexi bacterium]|nr:metallophosphoesterase [Chloroflexota bacterium]
MRQPLAQAVAGGRSNAAAHVRFAVIGDYGQASQAELDVANQVKGWTPDLIITTGDNNYPSGASSTIDQNIGQYYHDYIYPYSGGYGQAAVENRFLPALGNHDWYSAGAAPYLDYFALPGNERYYGFMRWPVQFFAVDSDASEPDGNTVASRQAEWLHSRLNTSCAPWKIVYMHHAPYSSGAVHGSTAALQWPYAAWSATAVLAGHEHTYERIVSDGIPYFVNGLGGSSIYSFTTTPVAGSQVRYNSDYGAMLVDADLTSITFQFISRAGVVVDTLTLLADAPVECRFHLPFIAK